MGTGGGPLTATCSKHEKLAQAFYSIEELRDQLTMLLARVKGVDYEPMPGKVQREELSLIDILVKGPEIIRTPVQLSLEQVAELEALLF